MSLTTQRPTHHRRRAVAEVPRLVPLVPGEMWVDPDYLPGLEEAGLTSVDAVMKTTHGRCLRALAERENWRMELRDNRGQLQGAYLKKHHAPVPWFALRRWLRKPIPASPGRTEAVNVSLLEREGIAAMRVIAYGERTSDQGWQESFVITEELTGFTQLDHFLRKRFPPLNEDSAGHRNREVRSLMESVALVARRFHERGYNHRDLYCCHFFIHEYQPGAFRVNLIDLQRVEYRRRFRRRWLVKDLAQLAYSAPRERISCKHKLAFMKMYLGVRKLRVQDKRLIRQVIAKWRRMEQHLGVHP